MSSTNPFYNDLYANFDTQKNEEAKIENEILKAEIKELKTERLQLLTLNMEKDRVIAQLIERLKSSRVDSLKLNKLTLPMSMQQEEMEKELADVKKKLQDSLENNTFLSVKLTKTQEMAEIYRKRYDEAQVKPQLDLTRPPPGFRYD